MNLLKRPTLPTMLSLALGFSLINILQIVYQITDMYWLGRLGSDAIAAVSAIAPLLFLLFSIALGFSMATGIIVGHHKGKGDDAEINSIVGKAVIFMIGIAALIALGGLATMRLILAPFALTSKVEGLAADYLYFSLLALPFVFLFTLLQSVLRNLGETIIPLIAVSVSVVLNFFLDPLFIFGWGPLPSLGVGGAAMSTALTELLSVLLVLGLSRMGKAPFGIYPKLPDWGFVKRLYKLALPIIVDQSVRSFGWMLITVMIAHYGTDMLAAYGVESRIIRFVIIPAMGISSAVGAMVAQAYGARRPDRIHEITKYGVLLSLAVFLPLTIMVYVLAESIIGLFLANSPSALVIAIEALRITSLGFCFSGLQLVLNAVFRGVGKPIWSMLISLTRLWLVRLPLLLLLPRFSITLWWAFPLSNVLAAGLAAILYLRWMLEK